MNLFTDPRTPEQNRHDVLGVTPQVTKRQDGAIVVQSHNRKATVHSQHLGKPWAVLSGEKIGWFDSKDEAVLFAMAEVTA